MSDEAASLRDYATVVRRRWRVIFVTVLAIVGGVAVYAFVRPPIYQAVADVQVEPVRQGDAQPAQGFLRPEELATQNHIAASHPVTKKVIDQLRLDMSPAELAGDRVSTEILRDTQVLRISVTADSRDLAARIANAYANSYIEYRREQAAAGIAAARKALQEREKELRDQISGIERDIGSASSAERSSLTRQRRSLEGLLGRVTTQVAATTETTSSGGGTVLAAAEVDRIAPKPVRDGSLALVLGLLLGGGLAFVRDHFDDTVHDDGVLRRILHGGPVVGAIPHWGRTVRPSRPVMVVEPRTPAAEAYRVLSANVRGMLAARRAKQEDGQNGDRGAEGRPAGACVLVTSVARNTGATSTAVNLAIASARGGLRVLLVDADLRQPAIADRFGLTGTVGLAEILSTGSSSGDLFCDAGVDNMRLLPAGTPPPNPTELLAGPKMVDILTALAARADLVVLDCGPAQLADPLELAPHVDLALLVVRAGKTHGTAVTEAMDRLERVGAPVGGVCTDVKRRGAKIDRRAAKIEQPAAKRASRHSGAPRPSPGTVMRS